MSVWVENPQDGGSAVWGCSTCDRGAWCSDHTTARIEARLHAQEHRTTVNVVGHRHGPAPDTVRDQHIQELRAQGATIRLIAAAVGLSTTGVIKALRRKASA